MYERRNNLHLDLIILGRPAQYSLRELYGIYETNFISYFQ